MQTGEGAITEINVTPLVDVCLVLVIIFMVISPFAMQAGIEVASSRGKAAKARTAVGENVRLELDAQGKLKLNGRPAAWETLPAELAKAVAASKDKLVSLDASPKARIGQVVEVLDQAKQAGAQRLALLNQG